MPSSTAIRRPSPYVSKHVLLERLATIHSAALARQAIGDVAARQRRISNLTPSPFTIDPDEQTVMSLKRLDIPADTSVPRGHIPAVNLGCSGLWLPSLALSSTNGSRRSDRADSLRLRHKWTTEELFHLRNFDLAVANLNDAIAIRRRIAAKLAERPSHTRALATLRTLLVFIAHRENVTIDTRDGLCIVVAPDPNSPILNNVDKVFASGSAVRLYDQSELPF